MNATTESVSAPAAAAPSGSARQGPSKSADLLHRYWLVLAWVGVIVLFSLLSPDRYYSTNNFTSILNSQSVLVLIAIAQLVPLVAGDFDLSPAGVAGLSNVLMAEMVLIHGWPVFAAGALVVAVGLIVGLVNAALVVRIGVDSLIVTLGVFTLLNGITLWVSASPTGGYYGTLNDILTAKYFRLQVAFWIVVAVALILWFWLKYLPSGRRLHFVGFNREVARLSGIRTSLLRMGSFMIAGGLAACAGMMLFGLLGGGSPTIGTAMIFPAITAVILGSTAITPGVYNVGGTFVAVYLLVFGITGLELLGYTGWVPQVFFGGALVIAVVGSKITGRNLLGRV